MTTATKIHPNFNHRFSTTHEDHLGISDNITAMANRASSILHLLSLQFGHNEDGYVVNAIDSAICEIEDIKAYLVAIAANSKS